MSNSFNVSTQREWINLIHTTPMRENPLQWFNEFDGHLYNYSTWPGSYKFKHNKHIYSRLLASLRNFKRHKLKSRAISNDTNTMNYQMSQHIRFTLKLMIPVLFLMPIESRFGFILAFRRTTQSYLKRLWFCYIEMWLTWDCFFLHSLSVFLIYYTFSLDFFFHKFPFLNSYQMRPLFALSCSVAYPRS